jgi:kinase-associated protein B
MTELQIGNIVTGIYKTGKYIGEITAIKPMHYLVKIHAVLKHPTQGDLHSHKEVNVPIFHERKSLSYGEQTNIPHKMVKLYEGDIPEYKQSLTEALEAKKSELILEDSAWAQRSLQNLEQLEKDYF